MAEELRQIPTPGQIRQKLKQVSFRHLQQRLRDTFQEIPEKCAFNKYRPILGTREFVGVCNYSDVATRGLVCDSRVPGGVQTAQGCPFWLALHTREEIKVEFRALMQSDRGKIAAAYPDIAALMWVLDGEGLGEEDLSDIEARTDIVPSCSVPVETDTAGTGKE